MGTEKDGPPTNGRVGIAISPEALAERVDRQMYERMIRDMGLWRTPGVPPVPEIYPQPGAGAGAVVGGSDAAPIPTTITSMAQVRTSKFFERGLDPLEMLCGRLRMRRDEHNFKGIDHVHVYAAADKVYVFYCKDGKSNTIEEDADLFPSDGLVAQFRLILG